MWAMWCSNSTGGSPLLDPTGVVYDAFGRLLDEFSTLLQDELKQRHEERKKRNELLAIMKRKSDEQAKQMNLLVKAAEWMQAHWRGLLARREMEKARKGKKKKKKK